MDPRPNPPVELRRLGRFARLLESKTARVSSARPCLPGPVFTVGFFLPYSPGHHRNHRPGSHFVLSFNPGHDRPRRDCQPFRLGFLATDRQSAPIREPNSNPAPSPNARAGHFAFRPASQLGIGKRPVSAIRAGVHLDCFHGFPLRKLRLKRLSCETGRIPSGPQTPGRVLASTGASLSITGPRKGRYFAIEVWISLFLSTRLWHSHDVRAWTFAPSQSVSTCEFKCLRTRTFIRFNPRCFTLGGACCLRGFLRPGWHQPIGLC